MRYFVTTARIIALASFVQTHGMDKQKKALVVANKSNVPLCIHSNDATTLATIIPTSTALTQNTDPIRFTHFNIDEIQKLAANSSQEAAVAIKGLATIAKKQQQIIKEQNTLTELQNFVIQDFADKTTKETEDLDNKLTELKSATARYKAYTNAPYRKYKNAAWLTARNFCYMGFAFNFLYTYYGYCDLTPNSNLQKAICYPTQIDPINTLFKLTHNFNPLGGFFS